MSNIVECSFGIALYKVIIISYLHYKALPTLYEILRLPIRKLSEEEIDTKRCLKEREPFLFPT